VNLRADYPRILTQIPSAKSAPDSGESPKVDKPPSLQAEKTTPKPMKPPSPEAAQGPVNIEDVPTSPTPFTSSYDTTLDSLRSESIEHPKMSPQSPRFHGLEAPSGSQPGKGSSMPRSGDQS
jgi:hypothetical protein